MPTGPGKDDQKRATAAKSLHKTLPVVELARSPILRSGLRQKSLFSNRSGTHQCSVARFTRNSGEFHYRAGYGLG